MSLADDKASKDLMLEHQAGDEAAMGTLHLAHQHRVRGFVASRTGLEETPESPHPDIDDLCKDVWVKVIEKARDYEATDVLFTTWLLSIARAVCAKKRKQDKRERDFMSDYTEKLRWADKSNDRKSSARLEREADEASDRVNLPAEVDCVLETAPEEQREAWRLRHDEGKSVVEVARLMNASIDTVKKRLKLCARKLAAALGSSFDPDWDENDDDE